MTRTAPRLALLAAVAAVLVLAGCGSSSGDDAADDTTSTTEAAATTTEATDTEATETTETTETTVDDTEAGDPAGDEICGPLKVLSDFDLESARLINAGDWTATQAYFVENTDDVLAAYDDAIALDTELTADLEALRAVTDTTAETAAGATDLEDFSSTLLAQPGIMEAGASGFALNTFAEETCGFSTGGQGG